MKPPRFAYARPETLDGAIAMLAESDDTAKILAGGQSLMPMLNLRVAAPAALIDINRIAELAFIARAGGEIRIGAMTRHRALEVSPEIRSALPILSRAAGEIGHMAIRNRGTIGGSLAHADPAAELPLVSVLLDAKIITRSRSGERTIAARDFLLGPMTSALGAGEIITEIRFPIPPGGVRFGFAEMCRRRGDFAIVAAACAVSFDARRRCIGARIAIGGAGSAPIAIDLNGAEGPDSLIAQAPEAAARAADPAADIHASADFRLRLVRVMTARAIRQCFGDAPPDAPARDANDA